MENRILITKKHIIKDEAFVPRFYQHDIKGNCIGFGFSITNTNEFNSILKKQINNSLDYTEAEILLDNSILQLYKDCENNIGQFFNYTDEFRQIYFINLCDLMGISQVLCKFKTSIISFLYNDYSKGVDLMHKNRWTGSYYNKSKRLRNCLDALRYGK